jgi:hypothetical protein
MGSKEIRYLSHFYIIIFILVLAIWSYFVFKFLVDLLGFEDGLLMSLLVIMTVIFVIIARTLDKLLHKKD